MGSNTGAKQAHKDEKFKERSDAKWNKRNGPSGQKPTQLILQLIKRKVYVAKEITKLKHMQM